MTRALVQACTKRNDEKQMIIDRDTNVHGCFVKKCENVPPPHTPSFATCINNTKQRSSWRELMKTNLTQNR